MSVKCNFICQSEYCNVRHTLKPCGFNSGEHIDGENIMKKENKTDSTGHKLADKCI